MLTRQQNISEVSIIFFFVLFLQNQKSLIFLLVIAVLINDARLFIC
jgi:hypothetical protein